MNELNEALTKLNEALDKYSVSLAQLLKLGAESIEDFRTDLGNFASKEGERVSNGAIASEKFRKEHGWETDPEALKENEERDQVLEDVESQGEYNTKEDRAVRHENS